MMPLRPEVLVKDFLRPPEVVGGMVAVGARENHVALEAGLHERRKKSRDVHVAFALGDFVTERLARAADGISSTDKLNLGAEGFGHAMRIIALHEHRPAVAAGGQERAAHFADDLAQSGGMNSPWLDRDGHAR